MEQEKLTQFRHTLCQRIRLGTAYACLVLVLLALGAFTAQHGWYRGFLTGLLSGIDIVVMICVARWRAMLRGMAEIGPRGRVGHFGAAFARRRCGPVFFPCSRPCADGCGLRAPSDKQSALLCAFKQVLSAPTARHGPERRKNRGCPAPGGPAFIRQRRRFDSAL